VFRDVRIPTLLLILTIAPWCAFAGSDGYTLRYKFKQGSVDKYSVDLIVVAGGISGSEGIPTVPVHGGGLNVIKVAKANANGSALIVESLENFHFSGKSAFDAPQVSRYLVGSRGETSPVGAKKSPNAIQFGDPTALAKLTTYLPELPVKPGDSWTAEARNPVTGVGNVTATSRFFKIERLDGIDTVRIHQSYTIPLTMDLLTPVSKALVRSTGKMKIAAAINFDPNAGRVVRASITGNGKFSLEPPGSAVAKTKPKPLSSKSKPKTKAQKLAPVPDNSYTLKVEVISTLMR
jgi:hypothetical protein